MRKNFFTFFFLLLLCVFISSPSIADAKKKCTLNYKRKTIYTEKSFTLKIRNAKKKVKWTVTKKKVVSLKSKSKTSVKVKGLKKGTVTITGKVKGSQKKYKCKVTVKKKKTSNKTTSTAKMKNIPSFLGFKENITSEQVFASLKTTKASSTNIFIKNMNVNENEYTFLVLSFVNKERDSFIEIVLNDSDYGKKQIYTTSSSKNKITSVDTSYDKTRDCYTTDVIILLPKSKKSLRTIDIEEVVFLRQSLGLQGKCDLNKSFSKKVTLSVSPQRVATSPYYFNLSENSSGGYTINSINANYSNICPSVIYIPKEFEGKAIDSLSGTAFKNEEIDTLIIPNNIKTIDGTMSGNIPHISTLIWDSPAKTSFEFNNITSLKIGKNVSEIYPRMFADSSKLKNLELEEGVEKIGENAFEYNNLGKITLPSTLKIFDGFPFYFSSAEIYITASNISITKTDSYIYHDSDFGGILHVKNTDVYNTLIDAGIPENQISSDFNW